MNVLLAFDKFKGTLRADEACAAAAAGLAAARPGWGVETAPLTDGGEGFTDILTAAMGGETLPARVRGPLLDPVEARIGLVPAGRLPPGIAGLADRPRQGFAAVVEMAQASGLQLIAPGRRNPWHTTSAGTGQLLRAAFYKGTAAVIMGIGGSATSDLGLGALEELGLVCRDAEGRRITGINPGKWPALASFAGDVPSEIPPLLIACDVANPLLGDGGAAAVYGGQKGLAPGDLARFDAGAARVADLLCDFFEAPPESRDEPGAGAAGGIAFGLRVAFAPRARLVPGFDLVASCLGLEEKLARADVVVTGEGRFDRSSLQGKGPGALARKAAATGRRTVVLAGSVEEGLGAKIPGLEVHPVSPPGPPPASAAAAAAHLRAAVERVFGRGAP